MRFQPLEKLINLHDGYARQFKIDHLQLLLLQNGGDVFLIEATCPHRGHPLGVATIDDSVIQCALHRYRFSLVDGHLIHATEDPCRDLRVYRLVFEGNEVGVMLEETG